MTEPQFHPVIRGITEQLERLTPKGRILGSYIIQNPRKVVFMTTKELSEACGVSEATVVRFVGQLGYGGYGDFQQALRDVLDSELSLPDRVDLPGMQGDGAGLLHRVVSEEMNNLRHFYETTDMAALDRIVDFLMQSLAVYVIGSRIIIAISRYPNELIKLGKLARRLGHTLLVIADNTLCPVIPFANLALTIPSKSIPLIGYPTSISCLMNYLVLKMVNQQHPQLKGHQERLEQVYLENDILFNMHI